MNIEKVIHQLEHEDNHRLAQVVKDFCSHMVLEILSEECLIEIKPLESDHFFDGQYWLEEILNAEIQIGLTDATALNVIFSTSCEMDEFTARQVTLDIEKMIFITGEGSEIEIDCRHIDAMISNRLLNDLV